MIACRRAGRMAATALVLARCRRRAEADCVVAEFFSLLAIAVVVGPIADSTPLAAAICDVHSILCQQAAMVRVAAAAMKRWPQDRLQHRFVKLDAADVPVWGPSA